LVGTNIPLPAREPTFSGDAIESICQHAAYDRAEIPKDVKIQKTSRHLIRSIPVAQLEDNTRKEASFEET
jgi:hypothetical protein